MCLLRTNRCSLKSLQTRSWDCWWPLPTTSMNQVSLQLLKKMQEIPKVQQFLKMNLLMEQLWKLDLLYRQNLWNLQVVMEQKFPAAALDVNPDHHHHRWLLHPNMLLVFPLHLLTINSAARVDWFAILNKWRNFFMVLRSPKHQHKLVMNLWWSFNKYVLF